MSTGQFENVFGWLYGFTGLKVEKSTLRDGMNYLAPRRNRNLGAGYNCTALYIYDTDQFAIDCCLSKRHGFQRMQSNVAEICLQRLGIRFEF